MAVGTSSRTALVLDAAWADHRLRHADAATARACIAQCEQMLEQRALGVRAEVWSRLNLSCSMPSLAAVADQLHVDARTLQRRLAREGTSFRELLDQARRRRATELLLTTDDSIREIATRLGYAETSTLTHAFARWHGTTPTNFRSVAH
jgi:AraC-like DNA-binding protein